MYGSGDTDIRTACEIGQPAHKATGRNRSQIWQQLEAVGIDSYQGSELLRPGLLLSSSTMAQARWLASAQDRPTKAHCMCTLSSQYPIATRGGLVPRKIGPWKCILLLEASSGYQINKQRKPSAMKEICWYKYPMLSFTSRYQTVRQTTK